jgi:hypothetical protein
LDFVHLGCSNLPYQLIKSDFLDIFANHLQMRAVLKEDKIEGRAG